MTLVSEAPSTTRTLSMREAINEALRLEMQRDPTVILMGEDVAGGATVPGFEQDDAWGGVLGVTKGLVQEFGRQRVLDTPISESAFIGAAVGAAATGLRPVAELMFVDFFGVCMDQIFNQGAKLRYMFGGKAKVPVVIRTMIGAGMGAAGQHSGCHYSVFTHMPGLKTVVPSTPADAKGLLAASIRDDDPVVFIEGEMLYNNKGEVPEQDEFLIPIGQAEVKRAGGDVTLICHSKTVAVALKAAEALAAENVQAEVVDLRTIRPLDAGAILSSVAKTNRAVVLEEGWPFAGVGAQVVDLIQREAFDLLDAPVLRVTGADVPMPYNKQLEKAAKVDAAKAVAAAKRVLYLG